MTEEYSVWCNHRDIDKLLIAVDNLIETLPKDSVISKEFIMGNPYCGGPEIMCIVKCTTKHSNSWNIPYFKGLSQIN